MARFRHARTPDACQGLSNKEVGILVHKKYQDFCHYRWELAGKLPDRRHNLFSQRVFDGREFELGDSI